MKYTLKYIYLGGLTRNYNNPFRVKIIQYHHTEIIFCDIFTQAACGSNTDGASSEQNSITYQFSFYFLAHFKVIFQYLLCTVKSCQITDYVVITKDEQKSLYSRSQSK